jgi:hypothetical protein
MIEAPIPQTASPRESSSLLIKILEWHSPLHLAAGM